MIEGTIAHHEKNITIGKQGRVIADIHAYSVIVEGDLKGDIHSDGLVSLADGASVTTGTARPHFLLWPSEIRVE